MSFAAKSTSPTVIDLNVGGQVYTTSRATLVKHAGSILSEWFEKDNGPSLLPKDNRGHYFVDRDGALFRYILDYLRDDRVILPSHFTERQRLVCEAKYYKLHELADQLTCRPATGLSLRSLSLESSSDCKGGAGFVTIGYQGTFSFGPQGLAADVNFRKINRILVCGRVSLCREVFGDTLNEGRDPDRGHQNDRDRYTARYYLKHALLEYAFDMLAEAGFKLISSCASGTSGATNEPKPSSNTEEDRWAHYNEFLFYRGP